MKNKIKIWTPVFDGNSIDALIPEVWAAEALMVLEANAVAAGLVYRDFEPEIAQFGDTVNAHRPAKFVAKRKGYDNDVVTQAATAENIPVVLNQHLYTSFIIKDGEESKSFKSLVDMYLTPALEAINQAMDIMVLSQVYHFMDNAVGKLGTALTATEIIEVETKFNTLHVPPGRRWGLLTPQAKGQVSSIDKFTDANRIGDDGTMIRQGALGYLFGTQWTMAHNAPSIAATETPLTSAVNLTAGYAAGSTSLVVTAFTTEWDAYVGGWCTIAGDMTPQKIISATDITETIVISPGLRRAVVDTAVITAYKAGAITADGALTMTEAGQVVPILYDGFDVAPQQGQLMSISTVGAVEDWDVESHASLQGPTTGSALLDTPLEALHLENALVGVGPVGNYSFCFHPEAIALVTRPLATPRAGTGALSAVANFNGLSIRVVITYDGVKQGHLVTVDMLAGIKVLNLDLGIPLLS